MGSLLHPIFRLSCSSNSEMLGRKSLALLDRFSVWTPQCSDVVSGAAHGNPGSVTSWVLSSLSYLAFVHQLLHLKSEVIIQLPYSG